MENQIKMLQLVLESSTLTKTNFHSRLSSLSNKKFWEQIITYLPFTRD
jgi:hypothetical protein